MKTSYMMIACCALLTGLGSCATDDTLNGGGNDNGLTDVGTNYLAFNIVSDAGGGSTRAWPDSPATDGDFNADSGDEQAITTTHRSNVAIFFNEDDSFNSMRELTRVGNPNDPNDPNDPVDDRYNNGTERTVGTFMANLKLEEGSSLPTKVLVVLNGYPDRLDNLAKIMQNGKSDAEYRLPNGKEPANDAEFILGYLTRRLTDEGIGNSNESIVLFSPSGENTEYCTMSNSVYVGTGNIDGDKKLSTNDDKGQTGTVYNLARIEEKNICATEDLAKENVLTIHVERLAVKVELKFGNALTKEELGTGTTNVIEGFRYPVLLTPNGEGVQPKVSQLPAGGTEVTKATKVDWAFAMLGWSTNAVARRMYLFKNLNDEREDITNTQDSPTHYANNKITKQFFSYWNDPLRARCYWAVDGHYADPKAYPVQYRYSKDNTTDNTYKDMAGSAPTDDKTANMPLYYYSFQQLRMICQGLVPNADPAKINEKNYTDFAQKGNLRTNLAYRYCGENVLGQALINDPGRIWRGASTHVVIFGQLLLGKEIADYKTKCMEQDNKLTQDLLKSVSDKLYAGGYYWDRAGYMQDAYTKIYRALTTSNRTVTDRFGTTGGGVINTPGGDIKLYYKRSTGTETPLDPEYLTNAVEDGLDMNAVHDKFDHTKDDCNGEDEPYEATDESHKGDNCIFRLSAANVSNGDGKVMLGLKKDCTLIIKGTTTGSGSQKERTITPAEFLSLAYEFVGTADLYALGRMYYYVPIYHAAAGSAATGAAPTKVGDIGVVRNNWYVLTVSSLLKPGIPVSDPSQPIIPNIDPSDRYLGLDVHILPWHVVNQEITLQ